MGPVDEVLQTKLASKTQVGDRDDLIIEDHASIQTI